MIRFGVFAQKGTSKPINLISATALPVRRQDVPPQPPHPPLHINVGRQPDRNGWSAETTSQRYDADS